MPQHYNVGGLPPFPQPGSPFPQFPQAPVPPGMSNPPFPPGTAPPTPSLPPTVPPPPTPAAPPAPTSGAPAGPAAPQQPAGPQQPQAAPAPSVLNQQTFLASVQSYPPTPEGLQAWYESIGSQIPGVGFIPHPREPKIVLPDGTIIDAIQGAGAPGARWQWLVEGVGGVGGGGGGGGAQLGAPIDFGQFFAGGQPGAVTPQFSPQTIERAGPEDAAFSNDVRARLLEALGQAQEPVTADTPFIRDQQNAFERAIERATERANIENAEALAARGVAQSGAGEVAREGLQQFFGEQSASNASSLVANELARRRSELQNMLGLAAGIGDADLARQLQRELGEADLNLRQLLGTEALGIDRERVGLQEAIARAQLALDQELGRGQLELGQGQLGLGFADLGRLTSQDLFNRSFQNDVFNQDLASQIAAAILAGGGG